MDNNASMIETLYHRTEEYAKTSFEILKLKTLEKSTEIASLMLARFIIIMIVFMFLLILSFGASFWLGEMLDKIYYGFLIIAAFWFSLGIVLYFFLSKSLKKIISDSIIKNAL